MSPTPEPQRHFLSNPLYDLLKLLALIIFPAIGTLYFTLAGIWGFPSAEQVLGTIVAIDTFLGVIIKLGDVSYNASGARFDGTVEVFPNADRTGGVIHLNPKTDPETLVEGKDEVIFEVKK